MYTFILVVDIAIVYIVLLPTFIKQFSKHIFFHFPFDEHKNTRNLTYPLSSFDLPWMNVNFLSNSSSRNVLDHCFIGNFWASVRI